MCWASVSARNGDSLSTTSPIASLTTSSKRDMCAPFWSEPRSTKQSMRARNSSSWMRTTFSTPVTPTRESPTGTEGGRAWTSSPSLCVVEGESICRVARIGAKASGRPAAGTGRRGCGQHREQHERPAILVSLRAQLVGSTPSTARDMPGSEPETRNKVASRYLYRWSSRQQAIVLDPEKAEHSRSEERSEREFAPDRKSTR